MGKCGRCGLITDELLEIRTPDLKTICEIICPECFAPMIKPGEPHIGEDD